MHTRAQVYRASPPFTVPGALGVAMCHRDVPCNITQHLCTTTTQPTGAWGRGDDTTTTGGVHAWKEAWANPPPRNPCRTAVRIFWNWNPGRRFSSQREPGTAPASCPREGAPRPSAMCAACSLLALLRSLVDGLSRAAQVLAPAALNPPKQPRTHSHSQHTQCFRTCTRKGAGGSQLLLALALPVQQASPHGGRPWVQGLPGWSVVPFFG